MRKIFLLVFLISMSFVKAQNGTLVPPDNVLKAFENQYPKKKAIWDLEYSGAGDDVTFEAKFNAAPKTIALARYDKNGAFKAYKLQVPITKLPKKVQTYLKTNYSVKSYKQFFSVTDNTDIKTYEAGVTKDSKFYNLIFDQDGEFSKKVQIR
ncbi:PepSY-like domain-containing protein [Flavobacterium sp. UW10123]|uniref:PepSY-like domain-containing protein n=1 Tax=Flavobacterium sp. UW10123 TaxID=3230800 RepID=UPI003397D7FE